MVCYTDETQLIMYSLNVNKCIILWIIGKFVYLFPLYSSIDRENIHIIFISVSRSVFLKSMKMSLFSIISINNNIVTLHDFCLVAEIFLYKNPIKQNNCQKLNNWK